MRDILFIGLMFLTAPVYGEPPKVDWGRYNQIGNMRPIETPPLAPPVYVPGNFSKAYPNIQKPTMGYPQPPSPGLNDKKGTR